MSSAEPNRVRVFLDTGVIMDGCISDWSAAKALLILLVLDARYTVVLAERVEDELRTAIANRSRRLTAERARELERFVAGWLRRARIERHAVPPEPVVRGLMYRVLPALRHANDMAAVATAMAVQPDWVISTNRAHWGDDLATRTGLCIATPQGFPLALRPAA